MPDGFFLIIVNGRAMAGSTRRDGDKLLSQRKKPTTRKRVEEAVSEPGKGFAGVTSEGAAALTISPRRKTGAAAAPSPAQRRYLVRGLGQPGGKLSLFDEDGQEVPVQTVESCITHGWAERWFDNPTKRNWIVARLTPAGYRALGHEPPETGSSPAKG